MKKIKLLFAAMLSMMAWTGAMADDPDASLYSARIGPERPGLGAKRRGHAPLPTHGISKITLKVVVFHLRP